uniref:MAM domain-containing protein n=1 Tax=Branchiostoma floridae TaxID=7739 RepID=C3ZH91_BRAFL|eukprot:XP_002592063.1 hypothetical protein BRAFLDRAFT_246509 [Branchiostoma floridae]
MVDSSTPGVFDCDFETDLCGWTQDSEDDFDWTRHEGSTDTGNTGPPYDHTMGDENGHYMYINTSSPRVEGDRALLYSPTVTTTCTMYLRFWYHMYGSAIETLNVYVRTDSSLPAVPVFTRTGEQGNQWLSAEVEISTTGNYYVVIEGISGSDITGQIALDDITLETGHCATGT